MSVSNYQSRIGTISFHAEGIYNFVTDLRNFDQFIPGETINNWYAEKESCSFNVSMIGKVSLKLAQKEMYSRIVYTGDALNKNDFKIVLQIKSVEDNSAEVKILLEADLNPMLKMMAAKPIEQFLEIMINEMEKFSGWNELKG